jgi:hypothetical protein
VDLSANFDGYDHYDTVVSMMEDTNNDSGRAFVHDVCYGLVCHSFQGLVTNDLLTVARSIALHQKWWATCPSTWRN